MKLPLRIRTARPGEGDLDKAVAFLGGRSGRRWRYSWRGFLGDALGGLIAALIALPYGLALASLMGLPPVLGVYTSILTTPVLVIFGRNPVLIGGTASVTVPFLAAACAEQGIGGAAKVSIVAAIFMLCFCVMRLGRYVAAIPLPVVSGFSCGIGGLMVVTQLKTIFGVEVATGGPIIMQLIRVMSQVADFQLFPILLALVVIAAASTSRRLWAQSPAPLLGVLAAAFVAQVAGWQGARLGELATALPPFVGFSWQPGDVWTVMPQALALAVVSSVNLLVTSRVVEHFRSHNRRVKKAAADVELGAYGMANLVAGTFGVPMSVGIPARSLANVRCGGTTRMSNLLHGAFLVGFLFFAQDMLAKLPLPILAGVTAWMGLCLLDWSTWRRLPKMRRLDAQAFLTTALAVLITNAVAAILLGCSFYVVNALYRRYTERGGLVEALTPAGSREGSD